MKIRIFLAATIDAMRARASVGEVSDALEEVFGRFAGQTETVKDIYKNTYGAAEEIDNIKVSLNAFINTTLNAVLYMAKLGQDGHVSAEQRSLLQHLAILVWMSEWRFVPNP